MVQKISDINEIVIDEVVDDKLYDSTGKEITSFDTSNITLKDAVMDVLLKRFGGLYENSCK